MTAMFSSPKKPDMSHIARQEEEARKAAEEQKANNEASMRALRSGAGGLGRRSLLSGAEGGVQSDLKSKLA